MNGKIKDIKKKWLSDKYAIYVINLNLSDAEWRLADGDLWEDIEKLRSAAILKEHSHVAEIVIANPDVEVYQMDGAQLVDFFEEYNPEMDYRVSRIGETFILEEDGVLELCDDGAIEKDSNDGGKNDFYTFAPYVKNVDSLSRFLRLSGAEFNVLKSLTYNLGARHAGTDDKREAKKCLHYAVERMLYTFTSEEILSQIQKQLKGN